MAAKFKHNTLLPPQVGAGGALSAQLASGETAALVFFDPADLYGARGGESGPATAPTDAEADALERTLLYSPATLVSRMDDADGGEGGTALLQTADGELRRVRGAAALRPVHAEDVAGVPDVLGLNDFTEVVSSYDGRPPRALPPPPPPARATPPPSRRPRTPQASFGVVAPAVRRERVVRVVDHRVRPRMFSRASCAPPPLPLPPPNAVRGVVGPRPRSGAHSRGGRKRIGGSQSSSPSSSPSPRAVVSTQK
jgi:hypothetical protein